MQRYPERFAGLGTVTPQDPIAAASEIERIMGPLDLNGIIINNRHAFAQRVIGAASPMPKLKLTPSEYFRRNFVLTTSGIEDPDVLALALRAVGEDNIMFAIDCSL